MDPHAFDPDVRTLERELGLGFYASRPPGIGGKIRTVAEDFEVREESAPAAKAHEGGKYTLARIRARNWETNRLVRVMARELGIPERTIYFTGTKDKRAVTVQNMAIAAPEEAVLSLSLGDVEILETRRVDRAPKIGEHTGNAFTIRLRSFELEPTEAHERAEAIAEDLREQRGFPNFYGPQRFGNVRPVTHEVGRKLVEGELEDAVWTYVAFPSAADRPEITQAREELWETRDPEQGLERLPKRFDYERQMLHHLVDQPGDAVGALDRLPRTLTRLFVGAFQSWLFNRALTRRAEHAHPRVALDGDILFPADADGQPEKDRLIPVGPDNVTRCQEATERGQGFTTAYLPGYDTRPAAGLQGQIEQELLDEVGVRPDDFRILDAPWLSSSGTRRNMWCPLDAIDVDAGEDEHGPYVELDFFLPKGSYATCLLREVMRAPLDAY